jgi:hypothetical protein
MKTPFLTAVLISLLIFLVHGCKPPVPPGIETSAASNITTTSMSSGGTVTSDGGAPVTARGICWSTSGSPSIDLTTKTNDGSGLGSFTSSLNGLSPNTTYYIRAYATNEAGTAYGTQVSATTLAASASLTTSQVADITSFGAVTGGNITNDGGANITSRGVCWNTSANPTSDLATRTQDGSGSGAFTSTLTGLASRTTYYVRAYAVNSAGTAYGQQITLETPASFSLSETSVTVASEGGSCNKVTVTAYLAWTAQITGNGNWLTLNTVSGNAGTSQLSFDFQPNTTSQDRTLTLTLTCQDMTLDLTVTQLRAGGYIDDGDLF